jgi:hypothetical protein
MAVSLMGANLVGPFPTMLYRIPRLASLNLNANYICLDVDTRPSLGARHWHGLTCP